MPQSLFLLKEGFNVLSAGNGNMGIKMIEQEHPDVVITDIIMPEKDGVEVALFLKMNYPDIKIIAMSSGGAISADEHLSYIYKLGADAVLPKPFTREEILGAVSGVFSA